MHSAGQVARANGVQKGAAAARRRTLECRASAFCRSQSSPGTFAFELRQIARVTELLLGSLITVYGICRTGACRMYKPPRKRIRRCHSQSDELKSA